MTELRRLREGVPEEELRRPRSYPKGACFCGWRTPAASPAGTGPRSCSLGKVRTVDEVVEEVEAVAVEPT